MGNIIKMNKIKPDNILSLKLPKSDIIFTRYLYIKDEVQIALLLSILNKSDDALFWAYELFYSGFYKGFFDFIWKVYYDFFATLNPSYEDYLLMKQQEYINKQDDKIVSCIVQDLLIRNFNTDVFTMRIYCNTFNMEYYPTGKIDKTQIKKWIIENDYRNICIFLLQLPNNSDFVSYYKIIISSFLCKNSLIDNFIKLIKQNICDPKLLLVVKTLTLFTEKQNLIETKNFYVSVEDNDIVNYITVSECDPNKVLQIISPDITNINMLNLFQINRLKYKSDELTNMYNYYWLYHASFSPIWHNRIKKYYGWIDYNKLDIKFKSDYYFEEFYNKYNYEPDEQPLTIKHKSIGTINTAFTWINFYDKYKNNGLIDVEKDELDELILEPVIY